MPISLFIATDNTTEHTISPCYQSVIDICHRYYRFTSTKCLRRRQCRHSLQYIIVRRHRRRRRHHRHHHFNNITVNNFIQHGSRPAKAITSSRSPPQQAAPTNTATSSSTTYHAYRKCNTLPPSTGFNTTGYHASPIAAVSVQSPPPLVQCTLSNSRTGQGFRHAWFITSSVVLK